MTGKMARGSRAGLLLWAALLQWVRSQGTADRVNGLSLHPPYMNIAKAAEISATATCGLDASRRPRPDLYCKLVGGPAAGLSGHTIQVPRPGEPRGRVAGTRDPCLWVGGGSPGCSFARVRGVVLVVEGSLARRERQCACVKE